MGQLNYLTFHRHFVELVLIRPWIIQIYECKICKIFLVFLQNAWWKHSMEAYFNISCSNILIDIINGIVISEKIKKKISCSLIPTFLMQTFLLWLSTSLYRYSCLFLTFQLIVTEVFMISEILYIIFTPHDQVFQSGKCEYNTQLLWGN